MSDHLADAVAPRDTEVEELATELAEERTLHNATRADRDRLRALLDPDNAHAVEVVASACSVGTGKRIRPRDRLAAEVVLAALREAVPIPTVDRFGYIRSYRERGLCGYPLGGVNAGTCIKPIDHDNGPARTSHVSDGSRKWNR